MEKKANGLVSLAALLLLAACECGDGAKDAAGSDVSVVEDEALAGSAADFVAKAGDRVFYEYDQSKLSQEAEATLSRQADWLKENVG
ncbi:MAG: hypothetical protein LBP41_00580, partial [Holosporaceae bacterium]|nr:hypothetical protein [Holosporaceae bacterium]